MKTPYKMSFLLIVKDPVTPRGADTVSFLILAINKGAENQLLRMSNIMPHICFVFFITIQLKA